MDWDSYTASRTGTGWQSSSLLAFQLYLVEGPPSISLYISPGTDEVVREAILASVNQNPAIFNHTGRTLTDGSIVIDMRDGIIDESDLSHWDDGTTRAKIEAWVKDFAENEFPAMNEVIVNCLRKYESEKNGG